MKGELIPKITTDDGILRKKFPTNFSSITEFFSAISYDGQLILIASISSAIYGRRIPPLAGVSGGTLETQDTLNILCGVHRLQISRLISLNPLIDETIQRLVLGYTIVHTGD